MNSSLKSMLIAAAAITAASVSAQDKATLDLLVKKGLISAEDRAKTLEEAAKARTSSGVNRVFPKEDATKRFTIGGYFQTQYQYFNYSQKTGAVSNSNFVDQSGFLIRRLYLDLTAELGEGLSGNIVIDTSGNTESSSSSWVDRAIVSHTSSIGTFDLGYRKVTWGYEESTLTSLFKASSSKLYTVERGITNRYWNEGETSSGASATSDSTRLGFGAHHTGLHFTSVPNPQGFEYGASIVNAAQGRYTEGKGLNDLAYYANAVFNWKVSDNEKYAIGVNWGTTPYYNKKNNLNTNATITGFNPFIQAQYFNWTGYVELMSSKVSSSKDAAVNTDDQDHTPMGSNVTLAYKLSDNWEAVARYTYLNTDMRGQKIADGERGFTKYSSGNSDSLYDKSNAWYLGMNYYFTLNAFGKEMTGHNAKIQFGYERANFSGKITQATVPTVDRTAKADLDAIRLQAQISF